MKTIFILCGVGQTGKTKTLKQFFGVSFNKIVTMVNPLEKLLNGVTIFAVGLSSPQEQEDFCHVNDVKRNIRRRIEKLPENHDYVLIIPFGVYGASKGKMNEDCIILPIEWLKNQGFRVFVIYLRKASARSEILIMSLMKKLNARIIDSTEDYGKQAKELERIMRTLQ